MKPSEARFWVPQKKLRVLVTGVTIDPPGATYGPRLNKNHEFIWIMDGEVTATLGRQVVKAEGGTLLLRRPKVRDYYEWSPKHRTIHAYVHFDLDPRLAALVAKPSVPAFRKLEPNNILTPLFGYLLELDNKKEPLRSRLILPALSLLVEAYATGETALRTQPATHLPEAVGKAVDLIRLKTAQEPPEPLHLKDLAQAAHTTPENLCRLFQKSLELGPLEYAKLARLDRAANQLRRTALGLKEIALSTGFYDGFHLSRSFKQVYGVSPKEFREAEMNEWLSQRNPIIRTFYSR